jgi:hypothetical protein
MRKHSGRSARIAAFTSRSRARYRATGTPENAQLKAHRHSTVTLSGFAVFADRSDMGLGSTPQFAIDKSPVCGRRTS